MINLFPVSDAEQDDVLTDNVIANPVGPHFEPPLPNTLTFELLDLWRRPKWVGFESLGGLQNLLLG